MGIQERLAAMKAAQTAAEGKKAAEAAAAEKTTKKSELMNHRTEVQTQVEAAQKDANEAQQAVSEAQAFAREMGENIAPDAKAELNALQAEATEIINKFTGLQAELARIDSEITVIEGGIVDGNAPTEVETPADAVETATEKEPMVETTPGETIPLEKLQEKTLSQFNELSKLTEELSSQPFNELDASQETITKIVQQRNDAINDYAAFAQRLLAEKPERGKNLKALMNNVTGKDIFDHIDTQLQRLTSKKSGLKQERFSVLLPEELQYSPAEVSSFLNVDDTSFKIYDTQYHPDPLQASLIKVNILDDSLNNFARLANKTNAEGAQLIQKKAEAVLTEYLAARPQIKTLYNALKQANPNASQIEIVSNLKPPSVPEHESKPLFNVFMSVQNAIKRTNKEKQSPAVATVQTAEQPTDETTPAVEPPAEKSSATLIKDSPTESPSEKPVSAMPETLEDSVEQMNTVFGKEFSSVVGTVEKLPLGEIQNPEDLMKQLVALRNKAYDATLQFGNHSAGQENPSKTQKNLDKIPRFIDAINFQIARIGDKLTGKTKERQGQTNIDQEGRYSPADTEKALALLDLQNSLTLQELKITPEAASQYYPAEGANSRTQAVFRQLLNKVDAEGLQILKNRAQKALDQFLQARPQINKKIESLKSQFPGKTSAELLSSSGSAESKELENLLAMVKIEEMNRDKIEAWQQ